MDNNMYTPDKPLKGKKKIQQQCLWEENKGKTLLRFFSEPLAMFLFGVMVLIRLNSLIKDVLGYGYGMIGKFFSYVIEFLPEQAKETVLAGIDSAPADMAISGAQHGIFSMLHLPKYHFPLYFFLVTFGALITYFIIFLFFQLFYENDNRRASTALNMVAYRNRRMLIPLLIGAVAIRVTFIVGFIAMFVAFIMGIVAVFNAFEAVHPRDKKNVWFGLLSLIVAAVVRMVLYNLLFFMILPSIF